MTDKERDEVIDKIKDGTFYEVGYPCNTIAFYDYENDVYYNHCGQKLRDPEEYNRHSEGYTPFGDEGY